MPDDLELRKRKAKAKARAARLRVPTPGQTQITQTPTAREGRVATINAGLESSGQAFGQAWENLTSGGVETLAAPANVAQGLMRVGAIPLSVIMNQLPPEIRDVVNKPLAAVQSELGSALQSGLESKGRYGPGLPPETAQKFSEPISELGTASMLAATGLGGKIASAKVGTGLRSGAVALERSAFQTGELLPSQRTSAGYTLERGIGFGEKGGRKAAAITKEMNTQVKALAEKHTAAGTLIDGQKLWERVYSETAEYHAGDPRRSPQTVNALYRALAGIEEMMRENPNGLTPTQVQQFKVRMNKELQTFYPKVKNASVKPKAAAGNFVDDVLTRALKESLEELDPKFQPLNLEESQAIKAKKSIEEYQKTHYPGEIGAGSLAAARGSPAGIALNVFGRRLDRSILAHGMNQLGKLMGGKSTPVPDPTFSPPVLFDRGRYYKLNKQTGGYIEVDHP